jgi:hypothetical protein
MVGSQRLRRMARLDLDIVALLQSWSRRIQWRITGTYHNALQLF